MKVQVLLPAPKRTGTQSRTCSFWCEQRPQRASARLFLLAKTNSNAASHTIVNRLLSAAFLKSSSPFCCRYAIACLFFLVRVKTLKNKIYKDIKKQRSCSQERCFILVVFNVNVNLLERNLYMILIKFILDFFKHIKIYRPIIVGFHPSTRDYING